MQTTNVNFLGSVATSQQSEQLVQHFPWEDGLCFGWWSEGGSGSEELGTRYEVGLACGQQVDRQRFRAVRLRLIWLLPRRHTHTSNFMHWDKVFCATVRLAGGLPRGRSDWLTDRLVDWLTDWLIDLLDGRNGYLGRWAEMWLAGWLLRCSCLWNVSVPGRIVERIPV